jgi:hypothetical protein
MCEQELLALFTAMGISVCEIKLAKNTGWRRVAVLLEPHTIEALQRYQNKVGVNVIQGGARTYDGNRELFQFVHKVDGESEG